MEPSFEHRQAYEQTRELITNVIHDEGLRDLPPIALGVALRVNDLMLKYPLDSIDNVEQRAVCHTDTSVLSFYRSSTPENQRVISVLFQHNCRHIVTISVITGCAVGASVPTLIGACVGGPPGALIAFLIGFPITFVMSLITGLSASAIQTMVHIKHDVTYIEWVEQAKREQRYESYVTYLKAYFPNDQEFFCPISGDFPKIPCRCPNGYIYDRASIEEYLERKEQYIAFRMASINEMDIPQERKDQALEELRSTVCPFRGPYYTKEELVYDARFALVLRKKLSDFIAERPMLERHVEVGLAALVLSLKRTENMIKAQKIAILTSRMAPLGLSIEKQSELIAEIVNS